MGKKQRGEWVGRRWFEFRTGYGTYMVFLFGFSNFILILYNFMPQLKSIVDLPVFAVVVFFLIIPLGVFIGHRHNKKQMPTESKIGQQHNAYRDKIVPSSKETMQINSTIFNQDYSIWSNDYNKWQLQLAEKQYNISNALIDALDLDSKLKYNKTDFNVLRNYKKELGTWSEGLKMWREKYKKYSEGGSASQV